MFRLEYKGTPIPVFKAAVQNLALFQRNPSLLDSDRYRIQSHVSQESFGKFAEKLMVSETKIEITKDNIKDFKALCDEFGYTGLNDEIEEFEAYNTYGNDNVKKDVCEIRELLEEHEIMIDALGNKIRELEDRLEWFTSNQDTDRKRMDALEQNLATISETADNQAVLADQRHSAAMAEISKISTALSTQITEKADKSELKTLIDEVEALKQNERKAEEELIRTLNEKDMTLAAAPSDSSNSLFTSDSGPFAGILAHLSKEAGGNPHEKGIIECAASETSRNQPYNVLDHGWNNRWSSADAPNAWIQFDFKTRRVALTGYTIKAGQDSYPIAWVLEVSNDGSSWQEVDRRNCFDLVGKWAVKTYELPQQSEKLYRIVRLRQTSKNVSGSNYLVISEIELFGHLVEVHKHESKHSHRHRVKE